METTGATNKALFVDEVEIFAIAGSGGNGCVAFRREKYIPRGGPSGGDGGNGGSVILQAEQSYTTLQHLSGKHHWRADNGGPGEGKNCHGRNGPDLVVRVPAGTLIYDAQTGTLLKDLAVLGDTCCVAAGGRGGWGNTHYKSATNQAPHQADPGEAGQERHLRLELTLIADAGLVGMPNAGKSTLLRHLSRARPKVAAYPFTTLRPYLGIVEISQFRRFVMADLPGLIEGAHHGAGLGDAFLRHIKRTRIIVHMLDVCPLEGDAVDNYRTIRGELAQYSALLADKREIVVANKMDLTDSEEHLRRLEKELGCEVIPISAVTGKGLERLVERIWQALEEDKAGVQKPKARRRKRT
jgi:GTP-binding protein